MRLSSAALLLILLLTACGKQPPSQNGAEAEQVATVPDEEGGEEGGKVDRSHAGQPAPVVAFQDPSGKTVSLSQFEGKPLLVNLWATWCAPCVTELPTLDKLAGELNGKVTVLAVSQDSSGREKVDAFFAQRKFQTLKPFLDSDMGLLNTLKADTLPTTVLYDADGREVWRIVGDEDWMSARAKALVGEAKA